MSRLARELSVLDGDNIHSMLASEEAVARTRTECQVKWIRELVG